MGLGQARAAISNSLELASAIIESVEGGRAHNHSSLPVRRIARSWATRFCAVGRKMEVRRLARGGQKRLDPGKPPGAGLMQGFREEVPSSNGVSGGPLGRADEVLGRGLAPPDLGQHHTQVRDCRRSINPDGAIAPARDCRSIQRPEVAQGWLLSAVVLPSQHLRRPEGQTPAGVPPRRMTTLARKPAAGSYRARE